MQNSLSRHAQQVMTLAQGKAQASGPAADPSIARSWLRCLEDYHLDPAQPVAPTVLEHGRMLECRERMQQVLEVANGEMNNLYRQLSGAGHAVLLTDARGVILNCVTAHAERPAFERAGLWLGADWSESSEGTNGIGTCVVERQALTIHQDEHFRSRHTGLTCSASPVFDPQGELMAVLDVSSARHDVSRQSQFHTMALVNLSAKMIESCYFLRRFEGKWLLRFHLQAEYVGLFSEGLLAFDGEGRISAVNQSAINLLGLPRERLIDQSVEAFFDCRLDDLLGRATPQPVTSWPLRTRNGRSLFAALRGQPRTIAQPIPLEPPKPTRPGICLGDAALQNDFRRALRVYERDVPLLINGETGSGKEAFARALHQASSRAERPFVALNCAAIPETLIESELFGYRGGSFTGARKEGMRGKLQQADGGTLFLDEIGDMPLALQTRLLRVLEERQVVPIGGEPLSVDVRIISATHRELEERVRSGGFREDLFYRLNGLVLDLPPLRDRSDKPELLHYLLAEEARGTRIVLTEESRQALLDYHWPGNVRQMRNVLRTLAALCEDGIIRIADLPREVLRAAPSATVPEPVASPLDDAERSALLNALDSQRWHMTRTAEQLGISRNTLYRKLRKHAIATRG
ncbi:sigma-54-dependent Fis family transcriptional regulator [Pseudomonas sp. JS3066]|uniref:sigma-54-dependent Fis family transcriptional regulator n=1 Tax=Pseudomonas sp. JS3066 TaxID=3090665 RepID=UPI002E7BE95D|nr:sigma-54-dependent Fis family transcriptional regulator [Pseudomonas sp. JS3066]WVK93868.1 sigma-54-dependent Fis family transcriptional regulator [Pseudomonas sp. JS3066]